MLPRLNRSYTSAALYPPNDDLEKPTLVLYSRKYSNLYMKGSLNGAGRGNGGRKTRSRRLTTPEWAGEEGEWDKKYKLSQSVPMLTLNKLSTGKSNPQKSIKHSNKNDNMGCPSQPSGFASNWCTNYAFSSLDEMHCEALNKHFRSGKSSRGRLTSATSTRTCALSPKTLAEHTEMMEKRYESSCREKLRPNSSASRTSAVYDQDVETIMKKDFILNWLKTVEDARNSNSMASVMGF